MFQMRRRAFLVAKFIHTLIVVRIFLTHLIPTEYFLAFILFLLIAQYYKEGYTPMILALLPILSLQVFGELNGYIQLQYLASILGGILHFIPLKMYWLPEPLKVVGFREDSLESGLHYY
jgi:hypothetical protein